MSSVLVSTKGMSRTDWLAWRRKGIGGSDASAVAGFNRYRSPMAVWVEKTGQFQPDEPGEAAYWGSQLEDLVAKEFAQRTELRVTRSNYMYQHAEYPWMLGNVDRLIHDKQRGKGILECKTASAYKAGEWDGDRIPDEYMIQMQHYMAVMDIEWGCFAVLLGGNKFVHKFVERNEAMIQSLIKLEHEFWQEYVLTGSAPPMDGSDASSELLNQLYPEAKQASEMDLTAEQFALLDQLLQAKEAKGFADEQVKLIENQLKDIIGDCEIAIYKGDPVVTWKNTSTTRIDSKKLKAEQPAIYEKYAVTTQSRRFVVK